MARRARKKRPSWKPPDLMVAQVLAWADVHFQRTGGWPMKTSGHIIGTIGEKWGNVHANLVRGGRGLPGGITLAQLLERERGVSNLKNRPRLTLKSILVWADAHFKRTGDWPVQSSGRIFDSPTNTWAGVDMALNVGGRGLPGGDTLAALLTRKRGARKKRNLPKLTRQLVLEWADLYYQENGCWPNHLAGPIAEAPGETWLAVEMALRQGIRGFKERSTLYQLLRKYRKIEPVSASA
jgi:hypothetical protein